LLFVVGERIEIVGRLSTFAASFFARAFRGDMMPPFSTCFEKGGTHRGSTT
jgi:hypothetical protein